MIREYGNVLATVDPLDPLAREVVEFNAINFCDRIAEEVPGRWLGDYEIVQGVGHSGIPYIGWYRQREVDD